MKAPRSPKRGSVAYVERRLRAAIKRAQKRGASIARGLFIQRDGRRVSRCCAMGAPSVGPGGVAMPGTCTERAAKLVGISNWSAWEIAIGFDGDRALAGHESKWHRLGRKLAVEFPPEASR